MQITTFNPQIITKDAAPIVQLFEELGFEKRHDQEGIGELNVEGIRMKDANGFYVDVSQPDVPLERDVATIRMNVDNFDEAFEMLKARGFVNAQGDRITETGTSRSTMMVSPSGFSISISQHIKNHD